MVLYQYTFASTVPYSSSYQYLTFLSSPFDYLNFRLFPWLTNCTVSISVYIRTALATLIVLLAGPYDSPTFHNLISHFLCTALKSDRSTLTPLDNMRFTLINNCNCDVYLWFNILFLSFSIVES